MLCPRVVIFTLGVIAYCVILPPRSRIPACGAICLFVAITPSSMELLVIVTIEPRHDKTNNVTVRPAKTQISLGICPV